MNKYRDKSDYELNLAVAHYLGYKPSLSGNIVTIKQEVKHGCIVYSENFDPCNNPADAMPIVFKSRIAICPIFSSDWCATSDCDAYRVINKNPLRAAMEVFLMMKDAENEK